MSKAGRGPNVIRKPFLNVRKTITSTVYKSKTDHSYPHDFSIFSHMLIPGQKSLVSRSPNPGAIYRIGELCSKMDHKSRGYSVIISENLR